MKPIDVYIPVIPIENELPKVGTEIIVVATDTLHNVNETQLREAVITSDLIDKSEPYITTFPALFIYDKITHYLKEQSRYVFTEEKLKEMISTIVDKSRRTGEWGYEVSTEDLINELT